MCYSIQVYFDVNERKLTSVICDRDQILKVNCCASGFQPVGHKSILNWTTVLQGVSKKWTNFKLLS